MHMWVEGALGALCGGGEGQLALEGFPQIPWPRGLAEVHFRAFGITRHLGVSSCPS